MRNNGDDGVKTGELVSNDATQAVAAIGADIDVQVATARRFPRSVEGFIQRIDALACRNEETAESMFYSMPREGKNITGPSVRFAELVASEWGNIRYGGTPIGEDGGFIICRGVAWDMEKNVSVTFDVKRRITKSNGARYSDDMIGVASNAGSAIALRNAVLRGVPQAYWRPIFEKARKVAVGDAKSFVGRRDRVMDGLAKLGVFPPVIFAHLGIAGVNDITPAHIEILIGRGTAIKADEMTIEAAFPPVNVETGEITMPQAKAPAPAPAAPAAAAPAASAPKPGPKPVDTKPTQPAEPPPPAKPAPVVEPKGDIVPDPADPSAAFDDEDPPVAAAVVDDGPVSEDERKGFLAACAARKVGIPEVKAHLLTLGVKDGKSGNVQRSQLAAVMAWAKGEPAAERQPGEEG